MTIKELMKKLAKKDPNLDIAVAICKNDEENEYVDVTDACLEPLENYMVTNGNSFDGDNIFIIYAEVR